MVPGGADRDRGPGGDLRGGRPCRSPSSPGDAGPEAREAALSARISGFREDTRGKRMRIADEAQRRFGRKVSWGASCGDLTDLVHDPVGAGDDPPPDGGAPCARHADRGGRGPEPESRPRLVRPAGRRAPGRLVEGPQGRAQEGPGSARRGADRARVLAGSCAQVSGRGSRLQEHGRKGTGASPSTDIRRPADPPCHPGAVVRRRHRPGDATLVDRRERRAAARRRSRLTSPGPSAPWIPTASWTDLGSGRPVGERRDRPRRRNLRLDARRPAGSRTGTGGSDPTPSRRANGGRGRSCGRSLLTRSRIRPSRSRTSIHPTRSIGGRRSRCSTAGWHADRAADSARATS